MSRAAGIPELINSLPSAWRVSSERGTFEISTEWLRENLGTLGYKYDEEVAKKIRDRLTQLRADLDEYEKDPRDVSRQRALMAGILSRGEFRELHGPSWSDQLKQRLIQLLLRLLGRAITSSIFSNVGKFFVYGLMGVAFLAVAYWVYRSIRTSTRVESIVPENLPVSARGVADMAGRGTRGGAKWKLARCGPFGVLGGYFAAGNARSLAAGLGAHTSRISSPDTGGESASSDAQQPDSQV